MSAVLSNRTNATLNCTLSAAEFAQKLLSGAELIAFTGEFEGEIFDAEVTIDELKRSPENSLFIFKGEVIVSIETHHCSKQAVGLLSISETGTVFGQFNLKPSTTLRWYASFDESGVEPSPEVTVRLSDEYHSLAGVQH